MNFWFSSALSKEGTLCFCFFTGRSKPWLFACAVFVLVWNLLLWEDPRLPPQLGGGIFSNPQQYMLNTILGNQIRTLKQCYLTFWYQVMDSWAFRFVFLIPLIYRWRRWSLDMITLSQSDFVLSEFTNWMPIHRWLLLSAVSLCFTRATWLLIPALLHFTNLPRAIYLGLRASVSSSL